MPFAAPGGIIGVNTEAFKYSDSKLNSICDCTRTCSHKSRHFTRQILEGIRSNQSLATVWQPLLLAVATNSPAATIGGQGILASQQLRFSRTL